MLCLLCLCARLFICALRSRKGLTFWLSSVVSNYEFSHFAIYCKVLIYVHTDLFVPQTSDLFGEIGANFFLKLLL